MVEFFLNFLTALWFFVYFLDPERLFQVLPVTKMPIYRFHHISFSLGHFAQKG
jgi:hypothetical protein